MFRAKEVTIRMCRMAARKCLSELGMTSSPITPSLQVAAFVPMHSATLYTTGLPLSLILHLDNE